MPYPLPGFLQVIAKDFPDLLLLVLGQDWNDALHGQILGVDVPARTEKIQSHSVRAHGRAERLLALRPQTGSVHPIARALARLMVARAGELTG